MKQTVIVLILSFLTFLSTLFVSSYVILECEKDAPKANILTYGDALWWTLNVSSVGDTNLQPVTNIGKIVGAIIIFIGVASFAVNTGLIAAIFNEIIKNEQKQITNKLKNKEKK